jgi:hypothetical protein
MLLFLMSVKRWITQVSLDTESTFMNATVIVMLRSPAFAAFSKISITTIIAIYIILIFA